jgi:K+-transporting ATPase c subunit
MASASGLDNQVAIQEGYAKTNRVRSQRMALEPGEFSEYN